MSAIADETAVITLEVNLVSKVTGLEPEEEPEFALPGVEGAIDEDLQEEIKDLVDQDIQDALEKALREEGLGEEQIENLTKLVTQVDSKGVGNITSFAKNPPAFMENAFINILSRAGPYGALIAAIITAVVAAPEVVKAIVEAFAVKGGPLNQDYRLTQEEFMSQEFDRTTQFKRLTGDDPVITVTTQGFVVGDPDFKGNSLIDINPARTGRVGLRDSSYGYIHGI